MPWTWQQPGWAWDATAQVAVWHQGGWWWHNDPPAQPVAPPQAPAFVALSAAVSGCGRHGWCGV